MSETRIVKPAEQLEITRELKGVLDAADRALAANDMVAYKALAREEQRLMDILKVFFKAQTDG